MKIIEEIDKVDALTKALQQAIEHKNTMTVTEFKQFHPLFKEGADSNNIEYQKLCNDWMRRVSMFDPIKIVDHKNNVVAELPPQFNTVETITQTSRPDEVIGRFTKAVAEHHPLRTDEEEATDIFRAHIAVSQNSQKLDEQALSFAQMAEAAGFKPSENSTQEQTQKMLEGLEWS